MLGQEGYAGLLGSARGPARRAVEEVLREECASRTTPSSGGRRAATLSPGRTRATSSGSTTAMRPSFPSSLSSSPLLGSWSATTRTCVSLGMISTQVREFFAGEVRFLSYEDAGMRAEVSARVLGDVKQEKKTRSCRPLRRPGPRRRRLAARLCRQRSSGFLCKWWPRGQGRLRHDRRGARCSAALVKT